MVASNSEESGRKAFDAQIQAFKLFHDKNPRAWLHIHAENTRAYDIPRILEIFGLFSTRSAFVDWKDNRKRTLGDAPIHGSCVSVTSAHMLNRLDDFDMAKLYTAADVLLAATCSEGCGVPILEAQLCGTPVVTNRTTAMWEETMLGISVPPCQWIARSDFNSGWWLPDARGVANALDTISQWPSEHLAEERRIQLPKLQKEFSNETIVQKWGAVLEKCKTPEVMLSQKRMLLLKVATKLRKSLRTMITKREEFELQKGIVTRHLRDASVREYVESVLKVVA
jgi:glycosyltransferase involved in cell wall biosynthesis